MNTISPALWLAVLFRLSASAAESPTTVLLWPGGAPGSEGMTAEEVVQTTTPGEQRVSSVHKPSITVFLPAKEQATGTAVIVAPGGGHRFLSITHEGYSVGKWLAEHGIAGFVLKYRLAREPGSPYAWEQHGLADIERSVRLVRSRAKEWNIDPARVGVLGFSAGGELAALLSSRPGEGTPDAPDPVDRLSAKPAFQILLYPGSSSRIQAAVGTPPTFLAAAYNDRADISEGLAEVYLRFKRAGLPVELHIYSDGGHGFGLRARNRAPIGQWPDRLLEWMSHSGFLKNQP